MNKIFPINFTVSCTSTQIIGIPTRVGTITHRYKVLKQAGVVHDIKHYNASYCDLILCTTPACFSTFYVVPTLVENSNSFVCQLLFFCKIRKKWRHVPQLPTIT